MNTTATKRIALAALAAPVLTALAVGLAAGAHADTTSPSGPPTAQDIVNQFKEDGYRVVVNTNESTPLDQCTIISSRQDRREHHGGPQRNQAITVTVDAYCPPAA
jgi:hypothetical protein